MRQAQQPLDRIEALAGKRRHRVGLFDRVPVGGRVDQLQELRRHRRIVRQQIGDDLAARRGQFELGGQFVVTARWTRQPGKPPGNLLRVEAGQPGIELLHSFQHQLDAPGDAGLGQKLMHTADTAEQGLQVAGIGEQDALGANMLAGDLVENLHAGHVLKPEIGDDGVTFKLGEVIQRIQAGVGEVGLPVAAIARHEFELQGGHLRRGAGGKQDALLAVIHSVWLVRPAGLLARHASRVFLNSSNNCSAAAGSNLPPGARPTINASIKPSARRMQYTRTCSNIQRICCGARR